MADEEKTSVPNDDELLANAIPIDESEQLEEEPLALEPEAPKRAKSTAMQTGNVTAGFAQTRGGAPKPVEVPQAIDLAEGAEAEAPKAIRTFGRQQRHEDQWSRTPNTTGTGAIHVKSFVAKLRLDAVDNMDNEINRWLDAHPEYEVKFVTASIGALTGKLTEPALFLTVWV